LDLITSLVVEKAESVYLVMRNTQKITYQANKKMPNLSQENETRELNVRKNLICLSKCNFYRKQLREENVCLLLLTVQSVLNGKLAESLFPRWSSQIGIRLPDQSRNHLSLNSRSIALQYPCKLSTLRAEIWTLENCNQKSVLT